MKEIFCLISLFIPLVNLQAQQIITDHATAMFDKAVKKQFKEWKGYASYKNAQERAKILRKIDSLDLSNDTLKRLPEQITKCPNLKHLNLLGNPDMDWKHVFSIISKTNINSVYVSIYDLSDIDTTYWHYITGIQILKTGLDEIPENILRQKQLTYLDLSAECCNENKFYILPAKLFDLTNLKYLKLKYCQIEKLPPQIKNLTNLIQLDLSQNNLATLPTEFGKLTKLTTLNLFDNHLTSLPPEFGNLINLHKLNLCCNALIILPREIGNLKNLTQLVLCTNKLTSIPPEFGNLKNLTQLVLCGNELTSIPPEFGNLKNLTQLILCCNQLTTFPTDISRLTKLAFLDLRSNKLITLPPQIGKLTNLRLLYLGNNKLTTLPQEIGNLKNLTELDVSSNNLTTLPTEIGKLKNLRQINLYSNPLRRAQFSHFLKTCTKKVQLTDNEDKADNYDPAILRIYVEYIEPEWEHLPNIEVLR